MVIDVRAQAVVVGATEVMARSIPSAALRVGASADRSRSCSQPSPSTTRSTTWVARVADSGSHPGVSTSASPRPSSAGTTLTMQAPS